MKICVIGTGKIANEVVAALRKEAPEVGITAVYAHSSMANAEKLAQGYDIAKVYTDYEKLLKEDTADFLYIGIVNTAHYDYARQALLAGRNVIVEKPFTSTYEEAAELAALARSRKLWLFEAVTTLHLPNYMLTKELLDKIAPIRIVQCNYSQYSSRYDRYLKGDVAPAFDPKLGGGALNDLNIYNINVVVGLLGLPRTMHYYANRGFNGIDISGVLVMKYDGSVAVCTAAKDSASPSSVIVQGEKGTIVIPSAPNEVKKVTLTVGGSVQEWQNNKYDSRLVHEFKDFERIWQSGDYDSMNRYLETSLSVMQVLDSLRNNNC